MKIDLLDYQLDAARWLIGKLRTASEDFANDGASAETLLLSAPTGAGKTVIMAAVFEAILSGVLAGTPSPYTDPNASFLWLTDSPQLNTQTIKRLAADTHLAAHQIVEIEADTFHTPTLPQGAVSFVNTQRLGSKGVLVRSGDRRQHTFWEVMTATFRESRAQLHATGHGSVTVIIDEAHRGMAHSARDSEEASSIAQRFLVGHRDETGQSLMPAAPIILGVSATPQHFENRLRGTSRTLAKKPIPPGVVRASGLLKQQIRLNHTSDAGLVDATLLTAAVRQRNEFSDAWSRYAPQVRPALLVQVEDAPRGNTGTLSATDLDAAIRVVDQANRAAGRNLEDSSFRHCFEIKRTVKAAGREIRYIEPSDIYDDPRVEIVLFKSALNTGWDCPRAEVLISYRAATDHTNIAQLVGRMVRAPLRRAVVGNDDAGLLNGVDLYLPRFNDESLDAVVAHLAGDSPEDNPVDPVRVVDLSLRIDVRYDDELRRSISETLGAVPTYDSPRRATGSPIRQLFRLARGLQRDSTGGEPVKPDASEDARCLLSDLLTAEIDSLVANPGWRDAVHQLETARVLTNIADFSGDSPAGDGGVAEAEHLVSDQDLTERVVELDRRLGGGIIKQTLNGMPTSGEDNRSACVRILAAFAADSHLEDRLNLFAAEVIIQWGETYRADIDALPTAERTEIEVVLRPPEAATRRHYENPLPEIVKMRKPRSNVAEVAKHLYTAADGEMTTEVSLNEWERAAIESVVGDPATIAWLRNERSGRQWHLAIPYTPDGGDHQRLTCPDLIALRRGSTSEPIKLHIIDPHSLHLSDAAAKLRGLAAYAAQAAGSGWPIHSIEAVAVIERRMRRRDLMDPQARREALDCRHVGDIKNWFTRDATPMEVTAESAEAAVHLSLDRERDESFFAVPHEKF